MFDRNQSLWAGYIIRTKKHRILFVCDSAYGKIFRRIGKRYGPFDLVIIGIGAYKPKNVMRYSHTTPEEAVKAAKHLKANIIVAMHWGTIVLSEEPPFEPPKRFLKAALKAGYSKKKVWIMKIGETRQIPNK